MTSTTAEHTPRGLSRGRARSMVIGATILLVLVTLDQAPLVDVVEGVSRFHVRPIDLAWVVFLAVALPRVAEGRWTWIRSINLRASRPILILALYCAWALLSLVWFRWHFGGNGFGRAAFNTARYLPLPILALTSAHMSSKEIGVIVAAVMAVASISAIWAAITWLTEVQSAHIGGHTYLYGVTRAAGPFGTAFSNGKNEDWWSGPGASNTLGYWLAVGSTAGTAFAAGLLKEPFALRMRWRVIAGGAIVGACGAGLLATHSRESWVAAVFACVVLLGAHRQKLSRRTQRVLLIGIPGLLVVLLVTVPSVLSRVTESAQPGSFAYNSGPVARVHAWGSGIRWGLEQFPLGWGQFGVSEHVVRFGQAAAENMFIQAWAELGLVGVAALGILCAMVGRRSLRGLGGPPDRTVAAVLGFAVFVPLCIHGMFGNTIGDPSVQILVAVAAGVSASPILASG